MGKRGPKPKEYISTKWSPDLAYAVGLLSSDGCLVDRKSLIDLTSKDREQLDNFKRILNLNVKIGRKSSGSNFSLYYRLQFKSVCFYDWLRYVGFTQRKSKTISDLKVPKEYFYDFLRGHHDGDGTFYSYWDKRWKSSFMYYLVFISASKTHLDWIKGILRNELNIEGHLTKGRNSSVYQLKFAKREGLTLLRKMYYSKGVVCLSRKRLKIEQALSIVDESL